MCTTGVGIILILFVVYCIYDLYFAPSMVYGQGMIGPNLLNYNLRILSGLLYCLSVALVKTNNLSFLHDKNKRKP